MKKVLVVVDMQNDFITGPLGNKDCEAVVPEVIHVIENGNYDSIYVTYDTHHENYLDTQEGRKLPVIHTVENTPGWEVHPDIIAAIAAFQMKNPDAPKEVRPFKKASFGSKALMEQIEKDVKFTDNNLQVDFVGVCTGICVISNAISAKMFAPEAVIRVIEKACACVTPQTHQTAIEAMKTCQIDIVEE